MCLDERLAKEGNLTVRFFRWDTPGLSRGLKQVKPSWLSSRSWSDSGFQCFERPTGGGLAFHGSDVSVSVIVPHQIGLRVAKLMRAVCEGAVACSSQFGARAKMILETPDVQGRVDYCLAQRNPYAITLGDFKVGGFAIRRYPSSWLIQGSILIRPLPRALENALPREVQEALTTRALPLAAVAEETITEDLFMQVWMDYWVEWWESSLLDEIKYTSSLTRV